jgi:hypothetical protein
MLKSALALFSLVALSTAAFAGPPSPSFSLACALQDGTTKVTFAGNGFQHGAIFRHWDLQGNLLYQGANAAGTPVEIKIPVDAANLIETNGALIFHSDDSTPAGFEAALTIWLPDNNLGGMPKAQEFTTTPGTPEKTSVDVADSTGAKHLYVNSDAAMQCAWTRAKSTKPGFFAQLIGGAVDVVGGTLFGALQDN